MQQDKVFLGMAGFGTVGSGLARILEQNREWIQRRLGRELVLKTVLVKDLNKTRAYLPDPATRLTDDPRELLEDREIDILVELIGGTTTARELITRALEAGRPVVSANKALLAEHGPELFELAAANNTALYYEASVAGGMPIVQALKESLSGNRINSLTGILNGTANYILSEMSATGIDFADALALAQDKGYAEADPELDIEGLDAAHKLAVLIRLAYGQDYPLERLTVQGISRVDPLDIQVAGEFGYRIKLLAQVKDQSGHLQAGVYPALVREDHILGKVEGPFNAVLLEGNAVGPIMLYGQGAGDLPTGSAVLADVMAIVRSQGRYNNTGFLEPRLPEAKILEPGQRVFRHYFRFTAQDRPGVLAGIAGIMGEHNISIAQVVQKESPGGSSVPVVFLSHKAPLEDVLAALKKISRQSFNTAPPVHYRIIS